MNILRPIALLLAIVILFVALSFGVGRIVDAVTTKRISTEAFSRIKRFLEQGQKVRIPGEFDQAFRRNSTTHSG